MTAKNTQQPRLYQNKPISVAIKNGQKSASPQPKPRKKITYIPTPLANEGIVQERSVLANITIPKPAEQKKTRNKITYVPGQLPVEGVVRLPSVLGVLGISKTSFLDGIRAKKYPAGKLLSPRCRVWSVIEIRALLASLEAEAV